MVEERMYDLVLRVSVPATTDHLKRTFRIENNFPLSVRQMEFITTNTDTTVRVRRVDGSYIEAENLQQGTMFMLGDAAVNFPSIQPPEVYPPHGAIEVDFSNPNALVDDVRLFLRGVQLVPAEQELSYVWPRRYRLQRFDYTLYDTIQNIDRLNDRVLNVEQDADFCILGVTSAQDNNQDTPIDLRYQFKSEWGWRYSSEPIDRLWLMGNYTPGWPRAFYPPIFIPRSASFYYDLVRNDALGAQARVMTRFVGYKVTEVCS